MQGQGSRAEQALVQADKKAVEVKGETAMDLYMMLQP